MHMPPDSTYTIKYYCDLTLLTGDPTIFGNLKPPAEVIKALTECLESGKYNGYAPATGEWTQFLISVK